MRVLYRIPIVRAVCARLVRGAFAFRYRNVFAAGVRVYGWPTIRLARGSFLHAGARTVLISVDEFSEWGLNHPCQIRTTSSDSLVFIGDDVGMSGVTIVCANKVSIGNRVLLGANVCITDTDSHPVDAVPRRYERTNVGVAAVEIGDDVFVGANSIVLKGASIGTGSVIGAGSVVTGVIPPFVAAAGNPARVLRSLNLSASGGPHV